ncbi:hypothetical protein TVAG_335930 [Trichomonas vaginalis G3]|uniref:Transcription elongation factor 1 homolog n=1 Tax=Trichomonas vaginalis (strain ATCC PRA-98 / G3) TaxID=412133 RepID=A2FQ96_TRIV3|nr:chromatin-mediated maintenance of transcription [Trichomonas vaginalis G3]EAX92931.1 hypothetical protein TVAG_335930 [Trichomonas vaginalis G3]KAI5510112.1 chromatin-mediated maintenance of transcription [Trichomonas vaginalis G3]|eukprot:XP_001305861.1 hypothetical protein [Trichomonas vaginalis G3]
MGKRKKSTPKVQKKFYRLPKNFHCPYCNCEDSVHVTMDLKNLRADIHCVKCKEGVPNAKITKISEPIDVYDDWVDQIREQNKNFNPDKEEQMTEIYEDEEPIYEPSRLQSNATRSNEDKHSGDENEIENTSDDESLSDDTDSLSETD